jgi:hypothetical protein
MHCNLRFAGLNCRFASLSNVSHLISLSPLPQCGLAMCAGYAMNARSHNADALGLELAILMLRKPRRHCQKAGQGRVVAGFSKQ